MFKRLFLGASFSAMLAFGAQAAHFVLDLQGDASTLATGSFSIPGGFLEYGSLNLTGLGSLVLSQGDTVSFEITIVNGSIVIPGRPDMLLGLDFDVAFPPATNPSLSGDLLFDNGYAGGGSCGNCLAVITGLPVGQTFSFASVTGSALVETLDTPTEISGLRLTYQLITPVPEPTAWALMIGGFGLVGAALRRRAAALA